MFVLGAFVGVEPAAVLAGSANPPPPQTAPVLEATTDRLVLSAEDVGLDVIEDGVEEVDEDDDELEDEAEDVRDDVTFSDVDAPLDEAVLDMVELYPDADGKVPMLVGWGAGVGSGVALAD